ncbi:glycosyltransferase family 4 protein [uncultured Thalassospira sp.]|uniref:glycosyltransferase family 4 protein n=1 Tax=uncultured Thalassospira sp. TaxID=404382 RepID=UPI0030DA09CD|tara:strand:+ start:3884 stop:4921 length:1038 start_codon:yes stop_codon:yes gene_type:complete
MAKIVLADDGIKFDAFTLDKKALGGAETAVISLAESMAALGHDVTICNRCDTPHRRNGVNWQPIDHDFPAMADLYIANRGDRLITKMPQARRTVFWIHNPAGFLKKWRFFRRLFAVRPAIVFSGQHHLATLPWWVPSGEKVIIPCGIENRFLNADVTDDIRQKRAIFTSNPLRSLDWLVDLWAEKIHPLVPDAQLHIFAGPQTYGAAGDRKALVMKGILDHASSLADRGVVLRGPVPKAELLDEMQAARVMPYRGDVGETFCLALGEAQAMGIPCVIQDVGCVAERIVDGETGFVASSDDAFVARTAELLTNDDLWLKQHKAAVKLQRDWGWSDAAQAFVNLIPE